MMEDIEKIIKIFETAKVSKLDLEFDNIKIKLEKNDEETKNIQITDAPAEVIEPQKVNGVPIKSPVVGTFYASKASGEAPFISIGQKVKKGDTLCIIEAMKVMNEIKSPLDGVVKEILVSNEDLVEYDETIIIIGE